MPFIIYVGFWIKKETRLPHGLRRLGRSLEKLGLDENHLLSIVSYPVGSKESPPPPPPPYVDNQLCPHELEAPCPKKSVTIESGEIHEEIRHSLGRFGREDDVDDLTGGRVRDCTKKLEDSITLVTAIPWSL